MEKSGGQGAHCKCATLRALVPAPFPPIEPPPSRAVFPDARRPDAPDVVAVGCDFSPGTLLAAYRNGIFPWPHDDPQRLERSRDEPLVLWFSPNPRAIFPLESEPAWARSLRRTLRTHPYQVTLDEDFSAVVRMCGETRPGHTWIIPELVEGYGRLHELGWAHSVEVWEQNPEGRVLIGGIYGLCIGGLFAGESMFHLRRDASKIAFVSLVDRLRARQMLVFDVQVQNPHLASLGCVEIARDEYFSRLAQALQRPATALSIQSLTRPGDAGPSQLG